MIKKHLFISFSGGETSALMTKMLLTQYRDRYDEVAVVFANTGQENEETLDFVLMCDELLGFPTVWVESMTHHNQRKSCTHKIVDYFTASRNGEPYEDATKKYGIANKSFPWCTRELKMNPMKSYIKTVLKWDLGTYDTAIGIRADEPSRRSEEANNLNLVYPLLDWNPMTKTDVNIFWSKQPFRLNLAGYQGNCKWCWKKSLRKLLTIMDDDPSIFDFPEKLETFYGHIGSEFKKEKRVVDYTSRTFFRNYVSVKELRSIYETTDFCRAENDAIVYGDRIITLDEEVGDGCTESCEVKWDD